VPYKLGHRIRQKNFFCFALRMVAQVVPEPPCEFLKVLVMPYSRYPFVP